MNAKELYAAVFDSVRSEYLPEKSAGREAFIKEVILYADGALDTLVPTNVAELVADAYLAECDGADDFWHRFEKRLIATEI